MKHFIYMSVFASSPDRLPYRLDCLALTVLCYCLLGLALVDEELGYGMILMQIILEVSLLALLCYIGLTWLKKPGRFIQSLTALVGANLVISMVSIPVANWLTEDIANESNINSKLLTVTMVMVFWNLAVMSQILKRSFEINTVMSAMIAFNYFLIYQFSVIWFY